MKTTHQVIAPPLPSSIEAEMALLGAVLIDNKALDECYGLQESDFYFEKNRLIYRRMTEMRENSEAIDIVTLHEKLSSCGEAGDAGGIPYYTSLADRLSMTDVHSVASYIKIIQQKAMLRGVIHITDFAQQLIFDGSSSVELIIDHTLQSLTDLVTEKLGFEFIEKSSRRAGVAMYDNFAGTISTIRVNSGIGELDKFTGGFRPGELVTITAGTGVGKTFMAQQIKRKACSEGLHGLYFSGEMSAEQLVSREIATEAGVEHWKMRRPEKLTAEDRAALVQTISTECEECRIVDGELSVRGIRIASRRMKQHGKLSWIVIDYDELVDAPGKDEFAQQRAVIREAKMLAIFLQVPVIILSQLRKSLDAKEAKKPTLERLYGSGAKSKHSSFVIFVDREYVRELKGDETKATIYILKARDGRVTMIPATFDLTTLRFRAETSEEKFLRGKKKSTMEKAVAEHQQPQEEEMF